MTPYLTKKQMEYQLFQGIKIVWQAKNGGVIHIIFIIGAERKTTVVHLARMYCILVVAEVSGDFALNTGMHWYVGQLQSWSWKNLYFFEILSGGLLSFLK